MSNEDAIISIEEHDADARAIVGQLLSGRIGCGWPRLRANSVNQSRHVVHSDVVGLHHHLNDRIAEQISEQFRLLMRKFFGHSTPVDERIIRVMSRSYQPTWRLKGEPHSLNNTIA